MRELYWERNTNIVLETGDDWALFQKAVIANDEDAREDCRTYKDEVAFVSVILETLYGLRDVVAEV